MNTSAAQTFVSPPVSVDGTFMGSGIIRLSIAILLISAATMKAISAQESVPMPYVQSYSLNISLILAEFVLGLWLISGWNVLNAQRAALLLFSSFFGFQGARLV